MLLDPVQEYTHIAEWIATLIGKKVNPRTLARKLTKHLNQYHPVRVKLHSDNVMLEPGDFTIGAEYDSDLDEHHKKQFIINLIINHPKHMPMEITGDFADRFTIELVEALIHEHRHQHQYRTRKHLLNRGYVSKHTDLAIKQDQEYLGQPDEIDAYAANIAARFYLLKDKLKEDDVTSWDLRQYYKVFGPYHPVIKRLLKKIVANTFYFKEHEHTGKRRKLTRRRQ